MKLAFVCGKTGGHTYPALTLAEHVRRRFPDAQCLFIGTKQGFDERLLTQKGETFYAIAGKAFPERVGLDWLRFALEMARGFWQAYRLLHSEKPDLLFAMGSHISFAPVVSARMLGLPVILFEPNVQMGRANRILSRWADVVATGFPIHGVKTAGNKFCFTGYPIRSQLEQLRREEALKYFGLEASRLTLLVMGGSQGAQSINRVMIEAVDYLKAVEDRIQIVHVVGERNFDALTASFQPNGLPYRIYPYIDQMHLALSAADILVGRAGAGMVSEAVFCAIPSIFIPYPYATDAHQRDNARYVADRHAAILLESESLNARLLAEKIALLVQDSALREAMRESCKVLHLGDGREKLVRLIQRVLDRQSPYV